jgi:hypothetical protein
MMEATGRAAEQHFNRHFPRYWLALRSPSELGKRKYNSFWRLVKNKTSTRGVIK